MPNPKIEKTKAEIEKTKTKISEYISRLRALERQKTSLENADIVALVRSEKISDAELSALMNTLRNPTRSEIVEAVIPGQNTVGQEELYYANPDDE